MNLGEVSLYIKLADTKCVHQGMQQSGHEATPCPPHQLSPLLLFHFILFIQTTTLQFSKNKDYNIAFYPFTQKWLK